MAKPVKLRKGMEFTFAPAKSGGAAESKYPWDQWFNGDLLLLEQSVGTKDEDGAIVEGTVTEKRDFEVSVNAMPSKIKTAARKRYKVCQISRYDADRNRLEDSLIIRARDMTDDERAAEDLQRAEDEAKAKDRRAKAKAGTNGATHAPAPAAAAQA